MQLEKFLLKESYLWLQIVLTLWQLGIDRRQLQQLHTTYCTIWNVRRRPSYAVKTSLCHLSLFEEVNLPNEMTMLYFGKSYTSWCDWIPSILAWPPWWTTLSIRLLHIYLRKAPLLPWYLLLQHHWYCQSVYWGFHSGHHSQRKHGPNWPTRYAGWPIATEDPPCFGCATIIFLICMLIFQRWELHTDIDIILLEGNLLKPGNPYCGPTTDQPTVEQLKYSCNRAQRCRRPTNNMFEV